MPTSVHIQTGSRLHFGPLSYHPDSGRHFGGVGLMIAEPGVQLTTGLADQDQVHGPSQERAEKYLAQFRDAIRKFSAETLSADSGFHIEITQAIPSHTGLGSGTQLGLAVAQALALLTGIKNFKLEQLARIVGRGARSAIGINGFQTGGLIVDAGKRDLSELGTPVCRLEIPANWRFLLVRPGTQSGLSGEAEKNAFAQLGAMKEELTERLCRLLLMELLPAVVAADFQEAGQAIYDYGASVGEFFSPVQGDIFAHPQMTALGKLLQAEGITGIGQSSWGPTLFALLPDDEQGNYWQNRLQSEPVGENCQIQVVKPMNHGAVIQFD